jgi:hypothetical protein
LRLANSFDKTKKHLLTAMHLSLSDELHTFNMGEKEKTVLPIFEESELLNIEIETI